jgi:hypothetical protein
MVDFLCSKISSFDVRRIQPTPKSSKVEIGFWLHSNKNSFYLDLYPCLGPMQRPHSMRGTRIGLGLCLSAMRRGTARAARRSHPTIGRSPRVSLRARLPARASPSARVSLSARLPPRASPSPRVSLRGVPLPARPARLAALSPGVPLPGRPALGAALSPGVPLAGRRPPRASRCPLTGSTEAAPPSRQTQTQSGPCCLRAVDGIG